MGPKGEAKMITSDEIERFKKALKDAFDRELIDVATQDEYDCAEAVAKMCFPDRQFTDDELWELEAVVDDYMFSPEWEGFVDDVE